METDQIKEYLLKMLDDNGKRRLSRLISEERARLGVPQGKFAEMLGGFMSQSLVSAWERG